MKKIFAKTVAVVGQLLFLYGFLGWLYGVLVSLVHPNWLCAPISHLTVWMRTDTFTIISFIVSAGGFFVWKLTSELIRSNPKS